MKLNELHPAKGSTKSPRRLGHGKGSCRGGTSGRGHKGQKARSGGYHKVGFEGGQMPLQRRLPKRGFTNIFKKEYAIVNLDRLEKFGKDTEINYEFLLKEGVISKSEAGLKVLGRGELTKSLVVKASKCSVSAKKKIEAAGGKVEVL